MSPLHRIGVIVSNELRLARRDPTPVMVLLVFPIVTIAFLKPALRPALVQGGLPDANGAEQVVPGQAVMSAFYLVTLVTFAFFAEHGWGTWDRLRASQASPLEIVAGKTLPRIAIGIVEFVVLIAAGVLLFGLHIRGDALALVPLVVAFCMCLVMLGVAVTAISRTAQQANVFGFTGLVLFGAIGGAFVPFNLLPAWARVVAPATPTYWAMRGMRSVIIDAQGIGGVFAPTAVLLALAVVFALVALRRLRFDETKTGFV